MGKPGFDTGRTSSIPGFIRINQAGVDVNQAVPSYSGPVEWPPWQEFFAARNRKENIIHYGTFWEIAEILSLSPSETKERISGYRPDDWTIYPIKRHYFMLKTGRRFKKGN